ncbi:unnamed protein product [Blepharisma stoltei]|uniref:UBA domain-containing protein n=1 Tax=Blepharisma stoltei TaxID=1481888 RepID=A0AAU9IF55_9CILI|nr:unnamed protein product [Blepharisma stoltei]
MINGYDIPQTNDFKISIENEEIKENAYSSKIISKLHKCLKRLQSTMKFVMKENIEAISAIQKQCECILKDIEFLQITLRKWISASKLTNIDDTYLNLVKNFKNSIKSHPLPLDKGFSSFLDSWYFNYDKQNYEELNNIFSSSINAPFSPSLIQKEEIKKMEEEKEPKEPIKEKKTKKLHQKTPKSEINEYDVLIVMRYTKVSKLQAIEALKATKGNFTNAILYLTTGKIPLDD